MALAASPAVLTEFLAGLLYRFEFGSEKIDLRVLVEEVKTLGGGFYPAYKVTPRDVWNVLTSRFGYNGSHEGDEESLGFRTKKGGHGPSSSTTSLDGFIANIKRKTIEEQREDALKEARVIIQNGSLMENINVRTLIVEGLCWEIEFPGHLVGSCVVGYHTIGQRPVVLLVPEGTGAERAAAAATLWSTRPDFERITICLKIGGCAAPYLPLGAVVAMGCSPSTSGVPMRTYATSRTLLHPDRAPTFEDSRIVGPIITKFPSAEVVQWQSDTTDQGGILDDVDNVRFHVHIAPVMNGPYFPEGSAALVQNFQAEWEAYAIADILKMKMAAGVMGFSCLSLNTDDLQGHFLHGEARRDGERRLVLALLDLLRYLN